MRKIMDEAKNMDNSISKAQMNIDILKVKAEYKVKEKVLEKEQLTKEL